MSSFSFILIKARAIVIQQAIMSLSTHLAVSSSLKRNWVKNCRGQQWYAQESPLECHVISSKGGKTCLQILPKCSHITPKYMTYVSSATTSACNLLFLIKNLGLSLITAPWGSKLPDLISAVKIMDMFLSLLLENATDIGVPSAF